jgi:hypothetical protein
MLKTPVGVQNIARANIKVIRKFLYWRRYFLKERVPIYYNDILTAIEEKKEFTSDEIKTYLVQAKSIKEVEHDAIAHITLQETLGYLEKKRIIKRNKKFHLNQDQEEDLAPEMTRQLFYTISLKYFSSLIFR